MSLGAQQEPAAFHIGGTVAKEMKASSEPRDIRSHAFEILTELFGVVWLLNAAFQASGWLLAPHGEAAANFLNALAKPEAKAPTWLQPLLLQALHGAQAIGPHIIALGMVAVAVLLGFSLLARTARGISCTVGIIYSLLCWVFLNALGYPYAHGQTDPGVFVAYAITFLFILSVQADSGTAANGKARPSNQLWSTARILFGLLWAFDAALKWLPAFLFHFMGQITSVIPGQPYWIAAWLHFVAAAVGFVGPVLVAVVVALTETVIALGLLSGRGLLAILPLGILYSLAVWATPEAFGGPYSVAGTGVRGNVLGNVIIYVIPFLFLAAEQYAVMQRRKLNARRNVK